MQMLSPTMSNDDKPVESEPKVFGLPLDMFVKGGTTTWAHDQEQLRLTHDAERRRNEAAVERQIATVPIEEGGGVIHGGPLGGHEGEQAYVELLYLTARGEQRFEMGEPVRCLADVVQVDKSELAIVLVCARCKERGVPLDRCQMRIRQSNRGWEFSSKRRGDMIPWVEKLDAQGRPMVKIYRSAGTIVESERFSCAQCGWMARIHDNKVRPDQ
jgi:hypothetical protein